MALVVAAGCSASHPAARTGPTTTLITVDRWSPPRVIGPPSTANFCALLVASYRHVGTLTEAANLKVKQEIVSDFVSEAPHIVAEAPPSIATPAYTYFQGVAGVLRALNKVGLNAQKLRPGQIGVDVLSPQMSAASSAVLSFSRTKCHYTIGG